MGKIAKDTGLIKRVRSINANILLFALIQAVAFSERSCRSVALALGVHGDVKVSRQAVWKFLKKAAIVRFLEKIIAHAIADSLTNSSILKIAENTKKSIEGVNRILIGDASSICLHPSLASAFKGAKNQTDALKAQLKLQLIVDVITGKIVHFTLDPYRRSDAKAALDFIPFLQSGDLLIRDLAFSSVACFKAITQRCAYYLSRLKAGDKVFDLEGVEIDLIDLLQKLAPFPGMTVRIPIKITASLFSSELVGIRVPDEVANERRRKLHAKAKKSGKGNPRKETLARQNWTLLTTNLPESKFDNNKIKELYLLRWRIEMIFKAAKSHSGLLKVAQHKTNANHAKALVLAWMLMVIIIASIGGFALGRLKEVYCPDGGASFELEIHNESLFKTFEKKILLLGFHLELAGCGGSASEHFRRTEFYGNIHNKTERTPGRTSLSEFLTSIMDLKNTKERPLS